MQSDKVETEEISIKANPKQFMDDKWTLGITQRLGNWLNLKLLSLTEEMFMYGNGVTCL